MSNLVEKSTEYDVNPFIVFDQNAKVIKYNQEAEYLISFVDAKEIFDLAMSYAPVNYGFKNSYINQEFNRGRYYAIQVGYEDEESIAVKLYKEVYHKDFTAKKIETTKTSIYTLIELSLNTILSTKRIKTEYDPSISETHFMVKEVMLLLNTLFSHFKDSENISIKVGVKLGAKLLVDDKRHKVGCMKISSEKINIQNFDKIEKLAKDADVLIFSDQNSITIEFALIS